MNEQVSESRDPLHDLVERETIHLDVVASWESLCDTYDALRFSDPITDTDRLEEFKWIIAEMNKFLSRMKTSMMRCKTPEAMVEFLRQNQFPTGKVTLEKRRALAFQKLRQRWITMEINLFLQMVEQEQQTQNLMQEEAYG